MKKNTKMSFKRDLHQKIPKGFHKTHEFNLLASVVEENGIKDVLQLLDHLDTEIRKYRKKLLDLDRGTNNIHRIDYAKWLESLERMRHLAEEYLRI